jgi:hypothetical protein
MTEENESEPLKDVMESDQAVEPEAKVAEELRMLTENEEGSQKKEVVTAYAIAGMPLLEYIISKKQQRRQKENTTTTLIDISKQLNKQTTEIERIGSVLQYIQKHIKPLAIHQLELIKQLQSQIKQIQNRLHKSKNM